MIGVMSFFAAMACSDDASPESGPPTCDHPEWGGVDVTDALHVGAGQPYTSVAQAIAAAGPDTRIALHDGDYDVEDLVLAHDGMTVVGRCRDQVTLRPEGIGLLVDGADVQLAGLTVAGGVPQGIVFGPGRARMAHMRVRDVRGWGVATAGTDLVLEDVEILDTKALSDESDISLSLNLLGGSLDATALLVDGSDLSGLYSDGTSVTLRRSRVTNLWRGAAIFADVLRLEGDVEVDHVNGLAIMAGTLETVGSVDIHDIGILFDNVNAISIAVTVVNSSSIGPGMTIEHVDGTAIGFDGGRTTVNGMIIRDACRILDTRGAVLGSPLVRRLDIRDLDLTDAACAGIEMVRSTGVTLHDVHIDDTRDAGILVESGDVAIEGLTVTDVRAGNRFGGVGLRTEGADVTAARVSVSDTDDYGLAFANTDATVTGARLTRATGAGVLAMGGTVSLTDVHIDAPRAAARRDWGGYGIYVGRLDSAGAAYTPAANAPALTVTDTAINRATGAGLVLADGTDARVDTLTISGTLSGSEARGDGALVLSRGQLDAVDLSTSGNARTGVLFDGATGSLRGGSLGETPGLVQQGCTADTPPVATAGVTVPGGTYLCDTSTPLPVTVAPPSWSDDIEILE
jgi:hypothetical protein